MIRKIIKINEELCNGCGLCVSACHEGAIAMVDGKAKLIRDDYCDGLGNCLPACPTNAITFEEREALPYNEEEVLKNMEANKNKATIMNHEMVKPLAGGCPGKQMRSLKPAIQVQEDTSQNTTPVSMLNQWPVQIQLVPPNAPYFKDSDLLIAADCTAFAYADFHRFMRNKITLIGCPKLDETDYSNKLSQILSYNDINSVTVIRMEVPCCGGIVNAVKEALRISGKVIPWRVITLSINGEVLDDR